MNSRILLHHLFIMFVLIYSSSAIITLIQYKDSATANAAGGGSLLQLLGFIVIYIISFILISQKSVYPKVVAILKQSKLLILFLIYSFSSILWSSNPAITVQKVVALFATVLLGIYLATSYNYRQLIKIIIITLFLVSIISCIFAVFLPQYGIQHGDSHEGSWRGVFINKNTLGKLMVLNVSISLLALLSNFKGKSLIFGNLLLSFFLLYKTTSTTALFVAIAMILIILFYRAIKINALLIPIVVFLFVLSGFVVTRYFFGYADTLFNIFGKDMSLTGRTVLWNAVDYMISQRPILGFGYQAFWFTGGPSEYIWQEINWQAPHAHNGFLDLILQLGYLGLFIFCCWIGYYLILSIKLIRNQQNIISMFPFVYMLYMLLYNFSESNFMTTNNIYMILMIAITSRLALNSVYGVEKYLLYTASMKGDPQWRNLKSVLLFLPKTGPN